jgi:hypothetical protein
MDVGNRVGRHRSSFSDKTHESGTERAGSAGKLLQWSLGGEIWIVELAGISGDREHAPPAQGPERSDELPDDDRGSD